MLDGSAFDLFAQIYEVCLAVSPALTPPVVDAMELWEVAVCMGKARPPDGDRPDRDQPDPPSAPPPRPGEAETAARRYEAIRRRRAGLPELEEPDERPAPPDPALATLITSNAPERLR